MEIYEEFYNKVRTPLESYLKNRNTYILDNITNDISDDYYATFLFDDMFLKISTIKNFHFAPLSNEIQIGNIKFSHHLLKPTVIYTYLSPNIAIKLEENIKANPLGTKRDDFSINIKYDENLLIERIKMISKPENENHPNLLTYNRNEKILKYISECEELLNPIIIEKCTTIIKNNITNDLFFSHGDLIPSNILYKDNDFIFIDWEWAAYRSKTFDLTLFLLFSNIPHCVILNFKNYFDNNSLKSAYLDTLLISLREIKNWKNELSYTINKEQKIEMWILTLQKAVDLIENFNDCT